MSNDPAERFRWEPGDIVMISSEAVEEEEYDRDSVPVVDETPL